MCYITLSYTIKYTTKYVFTLFTLFNKYETSKSNILFLT